MMRSKQLSLVLSLLAISGSFIVATRYSSGQPNQQSQPLRMRVARGKDHLKSKPTRQEIDTFKSSVHEEETGFEDVIPAHIPIKVKIRKEREKAFKDLKNENWARDFELEVTNTGTKPVYELYLLLITDLKAAAGFRIIAPLYYGRTELGDIRERATPEDIPINPGETIVMRIHPGQLDAWDVIRKKEKRPHPKKIRIEFKGLNFGDRTGYGPGGIALPRVISEQSGINRCIEPKNKDLPDLQAWQTDSQPSQSNTRWAEYLPAKFLPVNFLGSNLSNTTFAHLYIFPQDCCLGNGCTSLIRHLNHVCVNCPNRKGRPQRTVAILSVLVSQQSSTQSNVFSEMEILISVKPST